jgi:hypothetical protein
VIRYLPLESLRKAPDSLFSPLSDKEYEDLRISVMLHGIPEPFVVTPEENGFYTVILGSDYLGIAKEIGVKDARCVIMEKSEIDANLGRLLLFERAPTREERIEFESLKEKRFKEIVEREAERKLLPEFLERYKKGAIHLEVVVMLMKLEKEEQARLLEEVAEDSGVNKKRWNPPVGEMKIFIPHLHEALKQIGKERDRLKNKILSRKEAIAERETINELMNNLKRLLRLIKEKK